MFSGRAGTSEAICQKVGLGELKGRVEAALEADRRARAATHPLAAEPLEVGREDLDVVVEAEQPLHALVLLAGPLGPAEVRPPDVADEQACRRSAPSTAPGCAAGSPASIEIDSGRCPGVWTILQQERAEVDLLAVAQATEREYARRPTRGGRARRPSRRRACGCRRGDRRGGGCRSPGGCGSRAPRRGRGTAGRRRPDRRPPLARLSRRDEVGGAAEVVVQELLEVHGPRSPAWRSTTRRWTARGRRATSVATLTGYPTQFPSH